MAIRYLYHGTTVAVAQRALSEGLQPRGNHKPTHAHVPSHPDHVYMSQFYAPYYALDAAKNGKELGIVEIDLTKLDERCLYPDEDFVAQAARHQEGLSDLTEENRYLWARDHIGRFRHMAFSSLHKLGNIAHRGPIPAHAITRIVLWDGRNQFIRNTVADAQVTTMNARFCGPKYALLTRWFFEPVTAAEYLKADYGIDDSQELQKMICALGYNEAHLAQVLNERSGLSVMQARQW